MGISGVTGYGSSNYYDAAKASKTSGKNEDNKSAKTGASSASSADSVNTQKYLADLRDKNPEINIMCGGQDTSRTQNSNSKTDVMIAPSILSQMASDPEAAKKYEKMLSDIPALDKWADSMIRSITGSEVKYRQVWIDENGDMGSFCITSPSNSSKNDNILKFFSKY